MSNLLNIKDQNGNWIPIPVITNGIQSITQNQDYTLTITLNDGTTYTTTSIKGEDGQDYILTENDKQEIAQDVTELVDIPVDDVQIDGTSIVNNGIATIPIADTNNAGIVKINPSFGVGLVNDVLIINGANSNDIKSANNSTKAISTLRQHEATFYGLAKASGDTTQAQSENAIGTYTDDAKASIQSMLGVPSEDDVVTDVQINGASIINNGVADIPIASSSEKGVVGIDQTNGITITTSYGNLIINPATLSSVKAGTNTRYPIVPAHVHEAAFYGLAKAAGDITQSASANEVGTYTDEAKIAIKQMLDIKDDYDSLVVEVSGTDPVITGKPSYRYNCGELYTLSVTPPSSGTIDIIFTSGATPTVLDLPNTVKMPDWWAGIETNTTYEMCITDGVYCGVMSWAQ